MTIQPTPTDPLFLSLDELVRAGTLSGDEARSLYSTANAQVNDTARIPLGPPAVAVADRDGQDGIDPVRAASAGGLYAAALVSAGFLVTASLITDRDFAWKTFLLLVGVTVALGAGAAARLRLIDKGTTLKAGDAVTPVLATLAVAALALTVLATWSDSSAVGYLAGLLMLAGGIAGFWLLRHDALTVAAIAGAGIVLTRLLYDTVDVSDTSNGGASGPILTVGVAFTLFGIAVVAAGWAFSCRHTTGLIGSVIAVGSMLGVVLVGQVVLVYSVVAVQFGSGGGASRQEIVDDFNGDLRVAMILGLLVSLGVAALYAYTRRAPYAVVAFTGVSLLPFFVVLATAREHPLRWATALVIVGGLAVAAATAYQATRLRAPTQ